uniref:non-specific serine/threonine protein kinase n=1 Tax=Oryza barthii TaxID=65489 RepID=A0A0D3EQY1_9ORYZ
MLPVFSACCEELISRWMGAIGSDGSYEVDCWPELKSLTGDVISRTAFGSSYLEGRRIFELQGELFERVMKSVEKIFIPGYMYLPTENNRKMHQINKEIESILRSMIGKRMQAMKEGESTKDDLLGILLESNMRHTEENSQSSQGLTIKDIMEECKLFYFAGADTTSVLLTWTILLLSMHPEWQDRARKEILGLFGKNKPEYDGLSHLKIVTMILYEVLRLYPPFIELKRRTYKEMKIGGVTYPAGVIINLPVLFIHHDLEIWGSDVHEFKPERFSEGISKASKDPGAFLPFGWGPRICIGQNFALLEAKMALCLILQRLEFELAPTPGSSYRFLTGDLAEESRRRKEAWARPLPLRCHDIAPRIKPFLHSTVVREQHGKRRQPCITWFGPTPEVNITDPELAKVVLSNKFGHLERVRFKEVSKLLSQGLSYHEGEKWVKHRRIINPAFQLEKLKLMLPAFSACCEELISRWIGSIGSDGSYEVDCWSEMKSLTGDVISRTAFGSSYLEGRRVFELQAEQFERAMKCMQKISIPGYMSLPIENNRKMHQINKEIESILRGIIGKRMQAMKEGESTKDDLLGILLESNTKHMEENGQSSQGLTIKDIVEECKLFYFAGAETTSVLLTWTMLLLSMHPEWQDRAREEILGLFRKNKLDYEGLSRLKIVTMIFYEVLRLYPPFIEIGRKTYKEMEIGGVTYPAGVSIKIPVLFIHHDTDSWGSDVHEFKPERFSEGISKASKDPGAFLPFGWGPRICIGQNFALLEAKMALCLILQRLEFELTPSYTHAPHTMVTLHPMHECSNGTSAYNPNEMVIITRCITTERSALLAFRAGLSDPANLLPSWEGDDCCRWKGVGCSNRTGRVIKLDLRGSDCYNSTIKQVLGRNISDSLLDLHHLQYLDLSCNWFSGQQVPEFFGSLQNLRYLDLSESSFSGRIPPQLGNLSNLRYFSIGSSLDDIYSTDISWLSRLSSLEYLDMSWVNLSTIVHWVPTVNMLRSLKFLSLSCCELRTSPDSLLHSNLTSLETLDISGNRFNKHVAHNWFWDVTSLKHLDISYCQLHGRFPDELGNMTSMITLRMSGNNDILGMIPSNLNNLCNLEELSLFEININGSIAEFFERLPDCSRSKLRTLSLPMSNLTGSLPAKLEPFRNLTWLDLGGNNLTGPVPIWIGELTKLTYLDLSSNNLDGIMNEDHLSGLVSLEKLFLTGNSLAIVVNSTWVPSFSLTEVELRSCILGPKFPMWLRWQTRIFNLDISNTSISDKVPDWFWKMSSSVYSLNIRNNQISGFLPSTMEFMAAEAMDFSYNQFSGPIPKLPVNLTNLDLSRNRLSGPLPADFGAPSLEILFLFDNYISGTIPSLCNFQSLWVVDISGNKLTGSIPDCSFNTLTKNTSLNIVNLSLGNNKLSGKFPSFLQNCQKLVFLDLANNQLSGPLPVWIGEKLPSLAFLRLRSNMFYGYIPVELTKLFNLQYLDLAYNNISGSLPVSFVNFKGMAVTRDYDHNDKIPDPFVSGMSFGDNEMMDFTDNFNVVTKGQEQLYTGEIKYMVNLDLSCNNIIGQIPEEIGTLVALKNLNLSWNAFSGNIPDKIGALLQVESLDLSHNELSGEIPNSLSALASLSHLNLSYNNLSGKIPSGNQLQTLDDQPSIYIGNPGLCGPPLSKSCSPTELVPSAQKDHEDESEKVFFFLAMGIGYVMGIWTILCIFLFQRKWRAICFSFYDNMYDRVYVQVAITWASFKFYKEKWAGLN